MSGQAPADEMGILAAESSGNGEGKMTTEAIIDAAVSDQVIEAQPAKLSARNRSSKYLAAATRHSQNLPRTVHNSSAPDSRALLDGILSTAKESPEAIMDASKMSKSSLVKAFMRSGREV